MADDVGQPTADDTGQLVAPAVRDSGSDAGQEISTTMEIDDGIQGDQEDVTTQDSTPNDKPVMAVENLTNEETEEDDEVEDDEDEDDDDDTNEDDETVVTNHTKDGDEDYMEVDNNALSKAMRDLQHASQASVTSDTWTTHRTKKPSPATITTPTVSERTLVDLSSKYRVTFGGTRSKAFVRFVISHNKEQVGNCMENMFLTFKAFMQCKEMDLVINSIKDPNVCITNFEDLPKEIG